jgi:hypothetical protein
VGWNFFDVVTNQDQCRAAALCAQAIDVVDQVLASPGVEAGARFVEDQELRFRHERARNHDPLFFAL